jgi:hypothetical protein
MGSESLALTLCREVKNWQLVGRVKHRRCYHSLVLMVEWVLEKLANSVGLMLKVGKVKRVVAKELTNGVGGCGCLQKEMANCIQGCCQHLLVVSECG